MSDLISRQAAIDALTEANLKKHMDSVQDGGQINRSAIRIIMGLPTADVVEVVRCKECIHNRDIETSFGSKFHICNLSKLVFTQYADFYCAYGERKTDG